MLLSDEDRKRFSAWLRLKAESGKGIANQFDKFEDAISVQLAQRERKKVDAYIVVIAELEYGETMSVTQKETE